MLCSNDRLPTVVMATVLLLSGCAEESRPITTTVRGQAMGTTWQATLINAAVEAPRLQHEIAAQIETIESQMSHWRGDSLVSRFNRSRSTEPMAITADLAKVIDEALRVSQDTGGAFDITAAPLINLWGFGPPGRRTAIPGDAELAAAAADVGSHLLSLAQTDGGWTLAKQRPGVQLDLSALAKGYAIDVVARRLDQFACDGYLIELGGELRAHGVNSQGLAWRVGLEAPDPETLGKSRRAIALQDAAIATSGDYRLFFHDAKRAGTTYSHILDPRAGRPVAHRLTSVSVIARDAMRADAWATALMALGPEAGPRCAAQHKLAATFVFKTRDGFEEHSTPEFPPARQ